MPPLAPVTRARRGGWGEGEWVMVQEG